MKLIYTIKKSDVGKGLLTSSKKCPCCGITTEAMALKVSDVMGQVLPKDIGKRIFWTGRIYQVENDDQLAKRQHPN